MVIAGVLGNILYCTKSQAVNFFPPCRASRVVQTSTTNTNHIPTYKHPRTIFNPYQHLIDAVHAVF